MCQRLNLYNRPKKGPVFMIYYLSSKGKSGILIFFLFVFADFSNKNLFLKKSDKKNKTKKNNNCNNIYCWQKLLCYVQKTAVPWVFIESASSNESVPVEPHVKWSNFTAEVRVFTANWGLKGGATGGVVSLTDRLVCCDCFLTRQL